MKFGPFLLSLLGLSMLGCSHYNKEDSLLPHYSTVAHGTIEYYTLGKGSPIILIPGYATDVSSWSKDFLIELAKQHQLIVLNNRNVGGSRINSTSYKSSELANDVSELIKTLHFKKATVLGLSMGGMIALQVAASHPNQVKQLILINTALPGHQSVHPSPEMEKKMLSIPHNQIGFYLVAVDCFFPSSWKLKMAYKLVTDRFLPKHHQPIDLETMIPIQQTLLFDWADDEVTAKKIKQLSMPVLILNGKADQVIPPINSTILAKTIPHATLVHWGEGGHAMIYQFPKPMAQRINVFIESHS